MTDVTYAVIDDMEPIFDGIARRDARAELGVTAWGMQAHRPGPARRAGLVRARHGRGA